MKRFLLIPNEKKDNGLSVTKRVLSVLREVPDCVVYMQEMYVGLCDGERVLCCTAGELPQDAEAVLTIGGDGTVLEASRTALQLNIPLLGINLGRVGYLAELDADKLEELHRLASDGFEEREIMTLEASLVREGKTWPMPRLSVNDVTFCRSAGDMIDLSLADENGGHLRYLADGLILSTPTGSTAYSLSAGGPILSGKFDCICATPICPHSFFNRAILFGSGDVLHVFNKATSGDPIVVTMDGRENFLMAPGDEVIVKCSARRLRVLSPNKHDFLGILRKKMKLTE